VERRRWLFLGLATVVLSAVFLALRRQLGLAFDADSLRGAVDAMGVWGPLVFVLLVAFRVPLGFPSQLLLVAGGLAFGTVAGTLYGAAGLVVSGVVLFTAARWAGRDAVVARVPGRLRALLDVASSRLGAVFVAVGTGYPLGPITLYHLLAGVTKMAPPAFVVAVVVGSLVRAAVYTYFGSSLLSGDGDRLLQASAVLLLAAVLPLAFSRPRAWLFQVVGRGARG
jgi:uncharacterized membrane protein YdjX (TVP38/TMEM64 family)